MKYLYPLFFCFALLSTVYSQTPHLEFMGMPIDGSLASFTKSMQEKGFELMITEPHHNVLRGEFAGQQDVAIHILSTPKTDIVFEIQVGFQKENNITYRQLKSLMVKKYAPKFDVDSWKDHYGYEFPNTSPLSKYKIFSSFIDKLHSHNLIILGETYESRLYIQYNDHINDKINKEEMSSDL